MAKFSELIKNIDKKSEIYHDVALGVKTAEVATSETSFFAREQKVAPRPVAVMPQEADAVSDVHHVKPKPNAFLLTNLLKKESSAAAPQAKAVPVATPVSVRESDADIYEEMHAAVTAMYASGVDVLSQVTYPDLVALVGKIDGVSRNREFLTKVYALMIDESPEYLVRHVCATTVYSLITAHAMGCLGDEVLQIGVAALLHDIAMRDLHDVCSSKKPMTLPERSKVQAHVVRAESYLSSVAGMTPDVLKAVSQHHERVDGSGYPEKIDKRKVLPAARIIGFVDSFVALCGHRSYRVRKNSVDAYKVLLNVKNSFSKKTIKACIDFVGLYPVGSEVELNTGEHALVVGVNQANALRPKVMLVAAGNDAVTHKELDLMRHTSVYIKSAL